MFGAFAAFVPLFALTLPQKIATVPGLGGGRAVEALSWILVAGSVAAGGGNIVAGAISDALFRRTRSRRRMIAAGVVAVVAGLASVAVARSFAELVLAIVAFQLALNVLLSPLVALMVDYVPDERKGRMAGWLGLALPFGSVMVTLLAMFAPVSAGSNPIVSLFITMLVVLVLTAPLVVLWPVPALVSIELDPPDAIPLSGQRERRALIADFMLVWTARLLVQFAAAAILPYLYFYVANVLRPPGGAAAIGPAVGALAFAFAVMSMAGAIGIGWISDRLGHRRAPLAMAAMLVAICMATLSIAPVWPLTVVAYGCFAAGLAGFLAIDNALVAQLVAANPRRATLLGVMNLTNTLPSILAPAMALAVIGAQGETIRMVLVLQAAAVGAVVAALCASRIRTLR